MRFNLIASGSSGNAVLLENGLLLDCGITFKKLKPFLYDLKYVFISHTHKDHFNRSTILRIHEMRPTVKFLAGNFLIGELISLGIEKSNICTLPTNETQAFENLYVCAFKLNHDVPNLGLKIYDIKLKEKIFYAVDTGSIDHINAPGYNLYLIEANYEENKLKENARQDLNEKGFSYRIRAFYNHLSIQKAYSWLKKNMSPFSAYTMLHKSDSNFALLPEEI